MASKDAVGNHTMVLADLYCSTEYPRPYVHMALYQRHVNDTLLRHLLYLLDDWKESPVVLYGGTMQYMGVLCKPHLLHNVRACQEIYIFYLNVY